MLKSFLQLRQLGKQHQLLVINKPKGFTLLELLLSVALIALIALMAAPVYVNLIFNNDLEVAVQATVQILAQAQILAQGSNQDSAWSVHLENQSLTLFQGASFVGRNPAYDQVINLPNSVTVNQNGQDIVFNKFTGQLDSDYSLIFVSAGQSRTLNLNQYGVMD